MHRPSVLSCTALGLLLLGGCGREEPAARERAVPEVTVTVVQPGPVELRTELPGRTAAFAIAEIRPQVSGIVRRRLFDEGATVRAGQALYEIDPEPFEVAVQQQSAALADAEAAARVAQLLEERYRKLLPEGTISQQAYDDAAAAHAQARARVELARAAADAARINLRRTRIASPIHGRTGRSRVTPGALVEANQDDALTTVSQLDPIYVDLTQSSAELLRLRLARQAGRVTVDDGTRRVRLRLEDGSTYPHEGRLELSEVTVDPSTGSVVLRAVFPNPDALLLPGMYVRAEITEGVVPAGIRVPQQAVGRDRKGNAIVRIVDAEGRVREREVVATRAIGSDWLVESGLEAGERVITGGGANAQTGGEVRVAEGAPAAP